LRRAYFVTLFSMRGFDGNRNSVEKAGRKDEDGR